MITSNIKPFFCRAYCSNNLWRPSRQFATSAEVSARHFFGTGAELSRHFGTAPYQSDGAEMSWVRGVLSPKCLDTNHIIAGGKQKQASRILYPRNVTKIRLYNTHNILAT